MRRKELACAPPNFATRTRVGILAQLWFERGQGNNEEFISFPQNIYVRVCSFFGSCVWRILGSGAAG